MNNLKKRSQNALTHESVSLRLSRCYRSSSLYEGLKDAENLAFFSINLNSRIYIYIAQRKDLDDLKDDNDNIIKQRWCYNNNG